MTASAAQLTELLAPLVEAAGSDLENVDVSKAGKRSVVRVVVDRDGGVSMDDVADVSRVVSEALDVLDEQDPGALGLSYVLEVTSPGVDRPLTAPRHWRRNVGRLVTVAFRQGANVTGRVTAADDDSITLDVEGEQRIVPMVDVVRGTVQVEFSRKGEPAELEEEDA